MDPAVAWYPPEHICLASKIWTQIWETEIGVDNMALNNSNPNNYINKKQQDFIPLDNSSNLDYSTTNNNRQNNMRNIQFKRKRDNKASTYGLNHSSNKHFLRYDELTPWRREDRKYSMPGIIG